MSQPLFANQPEIEPRTEKELPVRDCDAYLATPVNAQLAPKIQNPVKYNDGIFCNNYHPGCFIGKSLSEIKATLDQVPFYQWNDETQSYDFQRGFAHRWFLNRLDKVTLYRIVTSKYEMELYQNIKAGRVPAEQLHKVSPGYGAIFTHTSNQRIGGSRGEYTYVMKFDVDFATLPEAYRDQIYVGYEYFTPEIAFITVAAREWLIRQMRTEYETFFDGKRVIF